ncbi:MAG: glycosyltransferase [Candidatus Sulfotelmatobacter sp.]
MPPDISVILPTYNRATSLRVTLDSFSRLSVPMDLKWELLVVDNNSTDNTREIIEALARSANVPVRYVCEKTQGRSAALNAGIAVARADIIAFTDDDVILHPAWLSSLKNTFDRFGCAAVAGRVVPSWNHPKPSWLEMEGQFAVVNFDLGDEIKEVRTPPLGANSAFRKEIFVKYGLFRLDLGVRGSKHTITCDDTEFGSRLIDAGEKIVYDPGAVIYHPVDPERTTKKYFLSWYYYNGVSLTRTAGLPPIQGTFYFGVPRWLFRELGANLCKWLFSFNGRRFQHRLHTYRSVGNIVESYRLSHIRTGNAALRQCR